MSKSNISSYGPVVLMLMIGLYPLSKAIAQSIDLDSFDIALELNQATATVLGYTSGAYSLASIINQDHYGNHCMGYGNPEPDHTMILKNDFERLRIQVESGGQDTTLIVRKSEQNDIRCGYGQKNSRDAIIDGQDWKAGVYEIWVGSMKPNQRSNYRLSVKQ